eukprot:COSAG06_NODE_299_length_18009_cov_6.715952_4_plen_107_part_00
MPMPRIHTSAVVCAARRRRRSSCQISRIESELYYNIVLLYIGPSAAIRPLAASGAPAAGRRRPGGRCAVVLAGCNCHPVCAGSLLLRLPVRWRYRGAATGAPVDCC